MLSSREVYLSLGTQIFTGVWSHPQHPRGGLHSLDTASPLDHLGKDSYYCRTVFASEVPRCQPRPALPAGLCRDSSLRPPAQTLFCTDPVPQPLPHETLNSRVLNQSPQQEEIPKRNSWRQDTSRLEAQLMSLMTWEEMTGSDGRWSWRRKWQPTPVFLPGESQGRGSLVSCRLWGRTESDTTGAT